jgi:hypothetical protein
VADAIYNIALLVVSGGLVWLVVAVVRRKPKKTLALTTAAAFVVALVAMPSGIAESPDGEGLASIADSSTPTPTATSAPVLSPTPTSTFAERKERALEPSYRDLLRNIDGYVSELVYYQGQVTQVVSRDGNSHVLRVYVTPGEFEFWQDDVILEYLGPRLLEQDIVEFVAVVFGERSYTTVLGASRTVPWLIAMDLQLLTP